jgi:hypothetical protein
MLNERVDRSGSVCWHGVAGMVTGRLIVPQKFSRMISVEVRTS